MARRPWRGLFDDRSRYLDRFGLLLAVTVAGIVLLSLVDLREDAGSVRADLSSLAATVVVAGTLVLALRASGAQRRLLRLAEVLAVAAVVATTLVTVVDVVGGDSSPAPAGGAPSFLWVTVSFLAPLAVVRRLFQHRRVTRATMLGAISAYLLLAVAFDLLFLAIDGTQGQAFFGEDEPTTSFMYFSLTTITTLGYGDLAAVTPVGRLAATFEAVIGQVFLVTFVAALVGLFVQDRGTAGAMLRPPTAGDAPPPGGAGTDDADDDAGASRDVDARGAASAAPGDPPAGPDEPSR